MNDINKSWKGLYAMIRFEYKCVFIWGAGEKTSSILNAYGSDGWDLLAVWWCWHYLKRAVQLSD